MHQPPALLTLGQRDAGLDRFPVDAQGKAILDGGPFNRRILPSAGSQEQGQQQCGEKVPETVRMGEVFGHVACKSKIAGPGGAAQAAAMAKKKASGASRQSRKTAPAPLLYADSASSADQYYLCGIRVPDPFLTWVHRGRSQGLLSSLEINRARTKSRLDNVHPLEEWMDRATKAFPGQASGTSRLIRLIAREAGIASFRVNFDFPAGLALELDEAGLKIEAAPPGSLFEGRERKSEAEVEAIRQANAIACAGFRTVERILRHTRIEGRRLLYHGRTLTSEFMQDQIRLACLEKGGLAEEPIVAGGDQACDPHERGSGPLRPHQLIIVDIFPRSLTSGYHGDMTRTYLKGKATPEQTALVEAVATAQKKAISAIRARTSAKKVHRAAKEVFAAYGFSNDNQEGQPTGFIHGTGHGLGLEVHEAPRLSDRTDDRLKTDQVVTVEPGLYYPGLGGCRIEDVVRVTGSGCDYLSQHPYRWSYR